MSKVKNVYASQADPAQEFAELVLAASSELERRMLSENVKRGMRLAKERKAKK